MRAMLLAAGLGTRLRPLTDSRPKPLLEVGGLTLIEHQIRRLQDAGIQEIVVNLHYMGQRIEKTLGDGSRWGAKIHYSWEQDLLETGGGIKAALDIIGDEAFAVVSSDVYMDMNYEDLPRNLVSGSLGCLVMVSNPPHHPRGDFSLNGDRLEFEGNRMTYSGVSVLNPEIFQGIEEDAFPLRWALERAITAGRLHGMLHNGYWCDVGTPERYALLQKHLSSLEADE